MLKLKSQGPTDNFRTMVRFTLPPSVPTGCAVQLAALRLHSPSSVSGRTLQALVLSGSWTEGGLTWANQPATTGTAATVSSGNGQRNWSVTSQPQANFTSVALAGARRGRPRGRPTPF